MMLYNIIFTDDMPSLNLEFPFLDPEFGSEPSTEPLFLNTWESSA